MASSDSERANARAKRIAEIPNWEALYPTGSSETLGFLWYHYEAEPPTGRFTWNARKWYGGDRDQADDLVGDLSVQLNRPEKAATYNPGIARWVTWSLHVERNLYLSQQRKKLIADCYEVTERSLEQLREALVLKAAKGAFPAETIPTVIAALEPLVGRCFVTRPAKGKKGETLRLETASKQLKAELRIRLRDTGILTQQELDIVSNLFRWICAAPLAAVPLENVSESEESSRPDIIVMKRQVLSMIRDWLYRETDKDPESAAVFYLRQYNDRTCSPDFDDIKKRLCERFPRMIPLVTDVADLPEMKRRPHKITWPDIRDAVFDTDDKNKANNCYERQSVPSLLQYAQEKRFDPEEIAGT